MKYTTQELIVFLSLPPCVLLSFLFFLLREIFHSSIYKIAASAERDRRTGFREQKAHRTGNFYPQPAFLPFFIIILQLLLAQEGGRPADISSDMIGEKVLQNHTHSEFFNDFNFIFIGTSGGESQSALEAE